MAFEIMSGHSSECNNLSWNEIIILVVDDDVTSLTFVAGFLKVWEYSVITASDGVEALHILGKQHIDLVLADVFLPAMNGFDLLQLVKNEFHLPVALMSADEREDLVVKGMELGAATFIRKPVNPDEIKNLWQYVIPRRNKGKPEGVEGIGSSRVAAATNVQKMKEAIAMPSEDRDDTASSAIGNKEKKPKRKYNKKSSSRANNAGDKNKKIGMANKKPKVVWTTRLHDAFLKALATIGFEDAVPKKILEVMKVPGLTRTNIASHLQKYRIFLKKFESATARNSSDDTFRILKSSLAPGFPSLLHPGFISNPLLARKLLQDEINALKYPKNPTTFHNMDSLQILDHQPNILSTTEPLLSTHDKGKLPMFSDSYRPGFVQDKLRSLDELLGRNNAAVFCANNNQTTQLPQNHPTLASPGIFSGAGAKAGSRLSSGATAQACNMLHPPLAGAFLDPNYLGREMTMDPINNVVEPTQFADYSNIPQFTSSTSNIQQDVNSFMQPPLQPALQSGLPSSSSNNNNVIFPNMSSNIFGEGDFSDILKEFDFSDFPDQSGINGGREIYGSGASETFQIDMNPQQETAEAVDQQKETEDREVDLFAWLDPFSNEQQLEDDFLNAELSNLYYNCSH